MASSITAKTLKVTINESISLNGTEQGGTNTLNISSITDVFKRIVTCTADQTTIVAVELGVIGAATLYQVTLKAGESHILGSADDLMLAEADTSPTFGTMADITSIQVRAVTVSVDIEIFVAST